MVRELSRRGQPVVAWSGNTPGELFGHPLRQVPLTEPDRIREAYSEANPLGVIHCAAISAISVVFQDEARALQVNRDATRLLGELTDRIVYTSTDLVFDGTSAPYDSSAAPSPLSKYGWSKVGGEEALRDHPGASTVRVSLMYGPPLIGSGGFFEQQVESLRDSRPVKLFNDEFRTPLAYDDAARGLLEVFESDHRGVLHLGGPERLSRLEMGLQLAQVLGHSPALLESVSSSDIDFPEPRAKDVSLVCDRSVLRGQPSSYSEGVRRLLQAM